MNFFTSFDIKYYMFKRRVHIKKIYIFITLIVIIVVVAPVLAVFNRKKAVADIQPQMQCITLWQVDGFEGGKGSRAQYLKSKAEKCFKQSKTYVNVVPLSADAARENMANGDFPDIISYSAGFYGLESYVGGKNFANKVWCRGGYCLLSIDERADFNDATAQNTVVNVGTDNLADVAAVLCGVGGAAMEEPTNAYLKLIGGKYRYMLGTQRDVFRLKARNVPFTIKPIEQFNDLYQNISILTDIGEKVELCNKFIDYLLKNSGVGALGLFGGGELVAEELNCMANTKFEHILNYPCGKDYIQSLKAAAASGDINKIKSLLK